MQLVADVCKGFASVIREKWHRLLQVHPEVEVLTR